MYYVRMFEYAVRGVACRSASIGISIYSISYAMYQYYSSVYATWYGIGHAIHVYAYLGTK